MPLSGSTNREKARLRLCEKLTSQVSLELDAHFSGIQLLRALDKRHASGNYAGALHLAELLLRDGVVVRRACSDGQVGSTDFAEAEADSVTEQLVEDDVLRYVFASAEISRSHENGCLSRQRAQTDPFRRLPPEENNISHSATSHDIARQRLSSDSPSPSAERRKCNLAKNRLHRSGDPDMLGQASRRLAELDAKPSPARRVCEKLAAAIQEKLMCGFSGNELRTAIAVQHATTVDAATTLARKMMLEGVVRRVAPVSGGRYETDIVFDDHPRYILHIPDGCSNSELSAASLCQDVDRDAASCGSPIEVANRAGMTPESSTADDRSTLRTRYVLSNCQQAEQSKPIRTKPRSPGRSLFLDSVDDIFAAHCRAVPAAPERRQGNDSGSVEASLSPVAVRDRVTTSASRLKAKHLSNLEAERLDGNMYDVKANAHYRHSSASLVAHNLAFRPNEVFDESEQRSSGVYESLRRAASAIAPHDKVQIAAALLVHLNGIRNCSRFDAVLVCDLVGESQLERANVGSKPEKAVRLALKRRHCSRVFSRFSDCAFEISLERRTKSKRGSTAPQELRFTLVSHSENADAGTEASITSHSRIIGRASVKAGQSTPGEVYNQWISFSHGGKRIAEVSVAWQLVTPVTFNAEYLLAQRHQAQLTQIYFSDLSPTIDLCMIAKSEAFAASLLRLAYCEGAARNLVLTAAGEFIRQSPPSPKASAAGLWRGAKAAPVTRCIRYYLLFGLEDFMSTTIQPFINHAVKTFSNSPRNLKRKTEWDVEIDPARMSPDADRKSNCLRLLALCTAFLDGLFGQLDSLPADVKVFFSELLSNAREMFPCCKPVELVGPLLFLRFFNAALLSPDKFALVPKGVQVTDNPHLARALTLVSKVSQLVANGVTQKDMIAEPWLHPVIPLLEHFQPKFKAFSDGLCASSDPHAAMYIQVCTQEERLKLMVILLHYTRSHWPDLIEAAASDTIRELAKILNISTG